MKMCINKRVVAALAVVGVALFVTSPRSLAAFAPVLVMAACPLSMLLMMNRMSGRAQSPEAATGGDRRARSLEDEVDRLAAERTLHEGQRSA